MKISFSIQAWEEYLYFQTQDKKTLKKINELIKDILGFYKSVILSFGVQIHENDINNLEKISEKLSERNWTVYKLCLKAGVGPAGIYRLRDGEVKDLYFDTVKKIADALEISVDELR